MTLPIVLSRPTTDRVATLGAVTEGAPPSGGAIGNADETAATEFRSALATAMGPGSPETSRDGAGALRRPRTTRQSAEASKLQRTATPAAKDERSTRLPDGDVVGERDDVKEATAADERASLLGSLIRESVRQRMSSSPPPIVVGSNASSTTSDDEGDATTDGGVDDTTGFVATSLELATTGFPASDRSDGAFAAATHGEVVGAGVGAAEAGSAARSGGAAGGTAPNDSDARLAALAAALRRDPLSVRRELEALAPALRDRLERIVDRMQSEFGYTVEVVESVRTPKRQEALFAQGRTTPGPVVTWTRASNHIEGRAVDVIIDGSYGSPQAYERLAEVSKEEGLRTLWPRDPGHVELPATRGGTGDRPTISLPHRGAEDEMRAQPIARPSDEMRAQPITRPSDEVHILPIPRGMRSGVDPDGRLMEPTTAPNAPSPSPRAMRSDSTALRLGAARVDADLAETASARVDRGVAEARTVRFDTAPLTRSMRMATTPVAVESDWQQQMLINAGPEHSLDATRRPSASVTPGLETRLPMREQSGQGDATMNAVPKMIVASAGSTARVATVATTATVAQVAQVATVARVATVEQAGDRAERSSAPAPIDNNLRSTTQVAGTTMNEGGRGGSSQGGERQASSDRRDGEREDILLGALVSRSEFDAARPMLSREPGTLDSRDGRSNASVAGVSRSDATERIARVLRMQESAGDRPLSSVLLRLDHPEGGEDRIRIDLRGHTVGATLDLSDPRAAEQLRAHAPELQQALQRQGLEGEALVVRSAPRSTDSAAYSVSAGAEREQARAASATASDGGGSTAKDSRNPPRAQYERDGTDQQRSRQRRDSKGGQK